MSAGPNAIHQRTKNITKPCTQNSESILRLIVCQKALILFTSFAQLLYSSCFILLKIFEKNWIQYFNTIKSNTEANRNCQNIKKCSI